mmetsp:Transcript_23131/g.46175  ORF Transcript_23131/g.46175 Transcript_23131/m.46175 type:complete len:298 (+) Transcript_23131:2384-3277(+)
MMTWPPMRDSVSSGRITTFRSRRATSTANIAPYPSATDVLRFTRGSTRVMVPNDGSVEATTAVSQKTAAESSGVNRISAPAPQHRLAAPSVSVTTRLSAESVLSLVQVGHLSSMAFTSSVPPATATTLLPTLHGVMHCMPFPVSSSGLKDMSVSPVSVIVTFAASPRGMVVPVAGGSTRKIPCTRTKGVMISTLACSGMWSFPTMLRPWGRRIVVNGFPGAVTSNVTHVPHGIFISAVEASSCEATKSDQDAHAAEVILALHVFSVDINTLSIRRRSYPPSALSSEVAGSLVTSDRS